MIFASATADIDQDDPVTTTFPIDQDDGSRRSSVGISHEEDRPPE